MASVPAPAARRTPLSDLDTRVWRTAFLVLLILECALFWLFPYFPSQDGPSHLQNASVLAHYGTTPIYQRYYQVVPFAPAGNMPTQFAMAALLKAAGPQTAEKILLSAYMVLFFLAFRYMLRALTPYADYFAVFAGILGPNYFVYMGFWNFCFSVPLTMFAIGWYAGQQVRATSADASNHWSRSGLQWGAWLIAGLVLYLTHAVSWVICTMAVAAIGLPRAGRALRDRQSQPLWRSVRGALAQYSLPIFGLLPPAVLMAVHLANSQGSGCPADSDSLRQRLWPLYSLSSLNTIGHRDPLLAKLVAVTLIFNLLYVSGAILRRRRCHWPSAPVLALSLLCGALATAGPDCLGGGSYIRQRVALFALLFFVAWLASALPTQSRFALNLSAGAFCAIALTTLTERIPALSEVNRSLLEFARMGQEIQPGSTVLPVYLGRHREGAVDPYRHAAGLLTPRTIVDLGNYEASKDYFSIRFRPHVSPFGALGTPEQLGSTPPVFDIERYERETKGRVDYLLYYGGDEGPGGATPGRQGYRLVRSAESKRLGRISLYRRSPEGVTGPYSLHPQ